MITRKEERFTSRYQGDTQKAFQNSHKRDLVGEPPGMGPRRFRKAFCEAPGIHLTKPLLMHPCFRVSVGKRPCSFCVAVTHPPPSDRKSTRLNSSHVATS